jgi:hypothetical protein
MKLLPREKSKVLAERKGWTLARAEGYVGGERARKRGTVPAKYILVGIDDYSQGFRAGYFSRSNAEKVVALGENTSVQADGKHKLHGSRDL